MTNPLRLPLEGQLDRSLEPPLERPLTRSRAAELLEAGVLGGDAARTLVAVCDELAPWRAPAAAEWRGFVLRMLLAVGVSLLALSGVFFFAANWSAFSGWGRIGLVATSVAISAALGIRLGTTRAAGKASLVLSGLLIGPLLAVYGQTFQTGADSYALFVAWAMLLIPFTVLVRWPGLVLFHIGLVQLGFALFTEQVWGIHFWEALAGYGNLAIVNGLAFVAMEGMRRRGLTSLTLPRVFLCSALFLSVPSMANGLATMFDAGGTFPMAQGLGLLALLLAVAAFARSESRDVFTIAVIGLAVTICASVLADHFFERVFKVLGWRVWQWSSVATGLFFMTSMGLVGTLVRWGVVVGHDEDEGTTEHQGDAL